MRTSLLAAILCLPLTTHAAPNKSKAPVRAIPAVPARPDEIPTAGVRLIDSEQNAPDISFITQAIDISKALRFLADQTPKSTNPALRGFGGDLVKSLAAQGAVLNTIAEMRQVRLPQAAGETEQRIASRCANLAGPQLDKALLDSFMEIDRHAATVYKLGAASKDPAIRKLAEQTLPQLHGHLLLAEAMADGTVPQRVNSTLPRPEPVLPPAGAAAPQNPITNTAPRPTPIGATRPVPGFRTNVRPPEDPAPAGNR